MTALQFLVAWASLMGWALRSSVLIASGALLLRVWRVKDPSIRWAAWTAILCASLAIPALTAALPKIPLAVMPPPRGRLEGRVEIHPDPLQQRHDVSPPDVRIDGQRTGASKGFDSARAVPRPDVRVETPAATVSKPFNWVRAAVMVYVFVALAFLLRLSFGLAMSLRLLRRSHMTGQATEGIEIRESDRVATPVALGFVRPAIVLPADWRQWDSAKLDAVLAHERSHIRRHDPAVQLLSAIHRILLWPTPLSWFLHRQIVRVAEEASDDAALAVTPDRALYAEFLLEFMQRGVWGASWQGVPVARYGRADKRIHRILDGTALSRGVTRWGLAAILALGLPLACVVACARPQSSTQAPTSPRQVIAQREHEQDLFNQAKAAQDAKKWNDAIALYTQVADMNGTLKDQALQAIAIVEALNQESDVSKIEKETYLEATSALQKKDYTQARSLFQHVIDLKVPDSTLAPQAQSELAKIEPILRNKAEPDAAAGNSVVRLLPSGDYQPWAWTVQKGQMVPDNSVEGGLKPMKLAMPPVAGAPAGADIVLIVNIDQNGRVTSTRILSDDHGLSPQVMAAAKGWRFSPPTVKGTPVSTSIPVMVTLIARATPPPALPTGPRTEPTPENPKPAAGAFDRRAAMARTTMGDFHRMRGEYDDAIAAYEDALKLDPSNAQFRQKLDATIIECKKENAVLGESFSCGATRPVVTPSPAPGSPPRPTPGVTPSPARNPAAAARVNMGDFHLRRGEYDEAIASYEESLRLDPFNTELRQKLNEAIKACQKDNSILNEGLKCGARNPVVTLIPSGDFERWNGPVTIGQMLPDNSIEGGLKPIGDLTVPPMKDAPLNAVVVFIITIDPNGNVTPGRLVSDDNGLAPQVKAAAKGWKFEPPTVRGEPVSTAIQVKVTF